MSDGIFPSLVSKSRDVNAANNPIYVQLTDGTNVLDTTNGGVEVFAANLDIRDLVKGTAAGEDNILIFANTVKDGSGTDYVPLVESDGKLQVVSNDASAEALWTDGENAGPGCMGFAALVVAQEAYDALMLLDEQDFGYPRMTLDRRLFGATDYYDDGAYTRGSFYANATGFIVCTDNDGIDDNDIGVARMTAQRKQINAAEFEDDVAYPIGQGATAYVDAVGFLADETTPDSVDEGDIGIARMTLDRKQLIVLADPDTDANRLAVNADGSVNVNVVSAIPSVNEVHNYDTSVNVGSDLTDNHDYTVPSDVFLLKSVIVSASGNMKFEIQTGPLATLTTKAVGFLNGRQGDTQQLFFDPAIEVPATSTGTVRIIRTNRQGSAMDVYSTIIGAIV